jgi:release factor glutamine methyltransferase
MSASSKLPAPTTINAWLDYATAELDRANIESARLDAELLLCHMLGVDRTWLIAHGEDSLARAALSQRGGARREGLKEYGEKILLRRLKREPIAYIVGRKDFYGREFAVTSDVLIPRPETEVMVELLTLPAESAKTLIDVGTGSGAIAVTAKLTFPHLKVDAVDVSEEALKVAKKNAKNFGAIVRFYQSDLLEQAGAHYDVICANLPYVSRDWQVSEDVHAEPDLALYADDNGLALIKRLIVQAAAKQTSSNYLLLEADPRQHDDIVTHGNEHGYEWYQTEGFIVTLEKK